MLFPYYYFFNYTNEYLKVLSQQMETLGAAEKGVEIKGELETTTTTRTSTTTTITITTIDGKPLRGFLFLTLYLFFILAIYHYNRDDGHNDCTPLPPTLQSTPKSLNASKRRWQQQQGLRLEAQHVSSLQYVFFLLLLIFVTLMLILG